MAFFLVTEEAKTAYVDKQKPVKQVQKFSYNAQEKIGKVLKSSSSEIFFKHVPSWTNVNAQNAVLCDKLPPVQHHFQFPPFFQFVQVFYEANVTSTLSTRNPFQHFHTVELFHEQLRRKSDSSLRVFRKKEYVRSHVLSRMISSSQFKNLIKATEVCLGLKMLCPLAYRAAL